MAILTTPRLAVVLFHHIAMYLQLGFTTSKNVTLKKDLTHCSGHHYPPSSARASVMFLDDFRRFGVFFRCIVGLFSIQSSTFAFLCRLSLSSSLSLVVLRVLSVIAQPPF